jgi:hypothetical protein
LNGIPPAKMASIQSLSTHRKIIMYSSEIKMRDSIFIILISYE